MDTQVLADQQRLIFISTVQTLDPVYKTDQKKWLTGKDGEKYSGEYMSSALLDDDNDDDS